MPTTVSPNSFVAILTALRIADRLHASASNVTLTPAQRAELEKTARQFEAEAT